MLVFEPVCALFSTIFTGSSQIRDSVVYNMPNVNNYKQEKDVWPSYHSCCERNIVYER